MTDVSNLSGTIVPKAEQLNAEELLHGPLTITVSDVRIGNDEQPVVIHFQGDNGRPFKPSKTVRKILIFAWGEDGRAWIGRSMTLYNDQSVRFGGMTVGGIRISHLSHIDRDISISLTATKGKKAQHTIHKLEVVTIDQVLKAIAAAKNKEGMNAAKQLAMQLTDEDEVQRAQLAYSEKVEILKKLSRPDAT
jgi:hypothetical protein